MTLGVHPLLLPGASALAPFLIGKSVRFRPLALAHMTRTPTVAGNRKTWTWSGWVKRGALGNAVSPLFMVRGSDTDATFFRIAFSVAAQDALLISTYNTTAVGLETTALFRDPASWYHVVLAFDTTQATASDRVKLYVNGTRITSFGTANYPALNTDYGVNATAAHYLGLQAGPTNYFLDGYLSEVNFVDGLALAPSAFGMSDPDTGQWVPIAPVVPDYGVNGFRLEFADGSAATAAAIGKDTSGKGNNLTPIGISLANDPSYDSSLDTPSNNYCVLNPLYRVNNGVPFNGNLSTAATANSTPNWLGTTLTVRSGKWYWEVSPTLSGSYGYVGIIDVDIPPNPASGGVGFMAGSASLELGTGILYQANASKGTTTHGGILAGDTLMFQLDMGAGTLLTGRNGVWDNGGVARITGLTGSKYVACSNYAGNGTMHFNFGQIPFKYAPPTGHKALCTANLPEPLIPNPKKHFGVQLYTGTGAARDVKGLDFSPDFAWLKARSVTAAHALFDTARGATRVLDTTTIAAELVVPDSLTAFNADGFSLGAGSTTFYTNRLNDSYVAWCWDEGVAPGLEIIAYPGNGVQDRSIPHSLGHAPYMVIVKSYQSAADNWCVWHWAASNSGDTDPRHLFLNSVSAMSAPGTSVFSRIPNASNVYLGNSVAVNGSGSSYVAYVFAQVPGFSKFGWYTGNGLADGPFLACDFKPKFVLIKRVDLTNANTVWCMHDGVRSPVNPVKGIIMANNGSMEVNPTIGYLDFLSNGFKVRIAADDAQNQSGGKYVFAAFAEAPFKYANAR